MLKIKLLYFVALLMLLLLCACTGKNVRVEGGGNNRDAAGAILIGTDF